MGTAKPFVLGYASHAVGVRRGGWRRRATNSTHGRIEHVWPAMKHVGGTARTDGTVACRAGLRAPEPAPPPRVAPSETAAPAIAAIAASASSHPNRRPSMVTPTTSENAPHHG